AADCGGSSANASGTLERRWCLTVGSFERGAEVTMAGKTEFKRQAGQAGIVAKQVKCSGQPQLQLVAIERKPFYLLEHLGEIDRRHADVGGDRRQRPTASQIGREHEFRAVNQFPTSNAAGRGSRAAPAQRWTQQLKDQTLGFECLDHATREAMTDQCRKHLDVGVKTQVASVERLTAFILEVTSRCQVHQRGY